MSVRHIHTETAEACENEILSAFTRALIVTINRSEGVATYDLVHMFPLIQPTWLQYYLDELVKEKRIRCKAGLYYP
jgi:hypothetical protein